MGTDKGRAGTVDGDEVPLLDKSAKRWVNLIAEFDLYGAVDNYSVCY
jgi:UDP-3-O-acyl-N-acetylglucosamine deacetylase